MSAIIEHQKPVRLTVFSDMMPYSLVDKYNSVSDERSEFRSSRSSDNVAAEYIGSHLRKPGSSCSFQ
jgi:hypothetical protein